MENMRWPARKIAFLGSMSVLFGTGTGLILSKIFFPTLFQFDGMMVLVATAFVAPHPALLYEVLIREGKVGWPFYGFAYAGSALYAFIWLGVWQLILG